MIIKPKDLIVEISTLYNKKQEMGFSTGWDEMDEYFTVRPSEFTVITGMPSHGKSEWLDCLTVQLAMMWNFRVAIFSPENHPLEMHLAKILEKFTQEKFFGDRRMPQETMLAAIELVNKHFAFVVPDNEEFTPRNVMQEAMPWLDMSSIQPKAMIIDPWNEMDHFRPSNLSETEYISKTLTELRRISREYKVHLFLVAHPKMLNKDKEGNYPVPRPYDISGSAHWYNKADNCIAVWRDVVNAPDKVDVHIQKVRFKTTGKPGMVTFRYNSDKSSYENPREAFYNAGYKD